MIIKELTIDTMTKINKFGIVPIGILERLYCVSQGHDYGYEGDMNIIYKKYDDVRHLFAMDLITAK